MSDTLVIIEQQQIIPNILEFHRVACYWSKTVMFHGWGYVYTIPLKKIISIFMR